MDEPTKGVSVEDATPTGETPTPQAPEAAQIPAEAETEAELPKEPAKQREAFISMRKSLSAKERENATLKARLVELEKDSEEVSQEQSVMDRLRGINTQQDLQPITPETDIETITSRMTQAEKVAYRSQQETADLKKQLADEAMYRIAPELNPEHPDNKKPEVKAFEKYLTSQIVLEGAQGADINDPKTIAKLTKAARVEFDGFSQFRREEIASQAVENLQKVEQASLEARGSAEPKSRTINLDELRARARRGDAEAMAEVLKNTVLAE